MRETEQPLTDAQIDAAAWREAWLQTFGMPLKSPRRPATASAECLTGDSPSTAADRSTVTTGPRRAGWSSTGYRGVYPTPEGRWAAKVRVAGKLWYLGTYDTCNEAARAVRQREAALFGTVARSGTRGGTDDEDEGERGGQSGRG